MVRRLLLAMQHLMPLVLPSIDGSTVKRHRQAPWALLIVVVMGSTLDDAATLVIAPSRLAV